MKRERNKDGMVYRGADDLIHIADGMRANMGRRMASILDEEIRDAAVAQGLRTSEQAWGMDQYGDYTEEAQPLCPGCYMVALFNCAVALANANGQSIHELGASMAQAFLSLAHGGESAMESIEVVLDPE